MFNFNHERWLIIVAVVRGARLVTEESFKWAMQRKVFGKPLIEQPVIRFKLAKMISETESVQNWRMFFVFFFVNFFF
jgi:alkylation response protein AidB-like acyl-CoA dehydrogenase